MLIVLYNKYKNHKTKVNALHCALNWLDLMCDVEGGREIQLISVIKYPEKPVQNAHFQWMITVNLKV